MEQLPRGKNSLLASHYPDHPRGQHVTLQVAGQNIQQNNLATKPSLEAASMPAGRAHGEVANQDSKSLVWTPREEGKDGMHGARKAECPNLHPRLREVEKKHDQGMQQKQAIGPTSPATPLTDFHSKNGSVFGPNILDTHSNEPRPAPLNQTPKQLTPTCHSHHEQPHSLPSSPRSRDGGPQTNMERSVIGAFTRRDSEFCPDTGPPIDSNAVEPGVTNPKPAAAARTTIPPTTLPQDSPSCSGGSLGTSLPSPCKDITCPTNQAVEYSNKLLQCEVPGPSARSHFPLPGSKRNKHCHEGRQALPLHCHVLKP